MVKPHLQLLALALDDVLAFVAPEHRPAIVVNDDYEPHDGGGLPVQALIIDNKIAVFSTMIEHKGGADEGYRAEELIVPEGLKISDPGQVSVAYRPHFVAKMIVEHLLHCFCEQFRNKDS